jgi:DNA-binding transcriptional MerR regulator
MKLLKLGNMLSKKPKPIVDKKSAVEPVKKTVKRKVEKTVSTNVKPSKKAYLDFKAQGLGKNEISNKMGITVGTLDYYRSKWGVTNGRKKKEDKLVKENESPVKEEVIKENKVLENKPVAKVQTSVNPKYVEDLKLDLKEVKTVLDQVTKERDQLLEKLQEVGQSSVKKLAEFEEERQRFKKELQLAESNNKLKQTHIEEIEKRYNAAIEFIRAHNF